MTVILRHPGDYRLLMVDGRLYRGWPPYPRNTTAIITRMKFSSYPPARKCRVMESDGLLTQQLWSLPRLQDYL
jgi:hypothetical protein